MASAVFEAAQDEAYESVEITVLPGVTAAQAVAAAAGAPLGGDYAVVSLSDRLKPWDVIADRLRSVSEADLVLAIYNPASRSRATQMALAKQVLLECRSPDTPVIIGRSVGRARESVQITTLGELDPTTIDMQCLLIIGATGTTVSGGRVWTRRSVPAVELSR
jgi:precorrin-2 C20-methyltransferase/precorrin-3B C17-methyltransferase